MKKQLRAAERLFITAILITLLVCPGLYAAEETLPTPEEIIAKNIEAMGGKEARKKIYNIKIVRIFKYVPVNKYEKVTAYQERPDKEYVLCEAKKEILRFGSNGKIAWTIHPQNGARLFEGVELSNRLLAAKFDRPDVPYKSMKTEGIEQINGKDCYKVVKTPEKGPERTVYYDRKSFMIVKTTAYYINPQENNKYEIYYEDYKKINGILFPYKEVHCSNGQRQEEITTEKIELNIEMPEGIFDIPEEIKAIMDKK